MALLKLLGVSLFLTGLASAAPNTNKVVCYYGSWSVYRNGNGRFTVNDINPNLCTHLIYTFVGLNPDGTIRILDPQLEQINGNLAKFTSLKTVNPKLKTLIAIGGWTEGSTKYSLVAQDPEKRSTLIQSALDLIKKYNFDGFDLDWEYPGQRGGASNDKDNFSLLLKEFRKKFNENNLLLSAAVAATSGSVDLSYHVKDLSDNLDFINVMAYDFHGVWEGVTGQNAPLYASSKDSIKTLNVDSAIKGWLQRGADPQKLVLGLGVYGRTFTLSTANTKLGAPVSNSGNPGVYTQESGMLGYLEICEMQKAGGWTQVWDAEQQVPYMFKNNQWVGFDDVESIKIKVNYAKSLNLAGVMIWSIETEDAKGICGEKYPLLNTIKRVLENGAANNSNNNEKGTTIKARSTTTTKKPQQPISQEVCTKEGYQRDPQNCNVFYYCLKVNNAYQPLKQQCNAGLYFNEALVTCDWPVNVNC